MLTSTLDKQFFLYSAVEIFFVDDGSATLRKIVLYANVRVPLSSVVILVLSEVHGQ